MYVYNLYALSSFALYGNQEKKIVMKPAFWKKPSITITHETKTPLKSKKFYIRVPLLINFYCKVQGQSMKFKLNPCIFVSIQHKKKLNQIAIKFFSNQFTI